MDAIKFSVVVPTRERASTLRHCLRSCLDQNFDDYEVIVSDNFSSPATREVVDEIGSSKVRYLRTPGPLAMSSSWEYALTHARGEYIVLIGDDDGLLPHALKEIDVLSRESHSRAIRWDAAYYTWPSFSIPGQENYLRIPLFRKLCVVESTRVISEVIGFHENYSLLPMFYNSAIHRDVTAELRAKTGRVFCNAIPDVYSGFAVAAVAGRFLSTDVPMSISGQSAASNGVAALFRRGQTSIDKEFREFNAKEGFLPYPRIPDLPAFPHVPVADSFLCAKQHLFPEAPMAMDRKRFVIGCVENLRVRTSEEWQWGMDLLRDSLSDDLGLQKWFDAGLAKTPFRIISSEIRPKTLGFDRQYLHLDAAGFGVTNVYEAAQQCENILKYKRDGVEYHRTEAVYEKGLIAELREECDRLRNVCRERLNLINEMHGQITMFQQEGLLKQIGRRIKRTIFGAIRPSSPVRR